MDHGALNEAGQQLAAAGMALNRENQVTCCYAVADKIWVSDPDGHRWELFVVLDAEAGSRRASSGCCAVDCCLTGSSSVTASGSSIECNPGSWP